MEVFEGVELVYSQTYFNPKPVRVIRIKSAAPIQSLSATEVSSSAGSFGFSSDGLGLENRFIIWRAEGPNLFLDEFSTDSDLHDSSICLNFTHTKILPGTQIFVYRGFLILVVPTQSSLHWFYVSMNTDSDSRGPLRPNYSILSLFPNECDLQAPTYGFYWLTTTGIAKKAEVVLLRDGRIQSAFLMVDSPIVMVSLPPFGNDNRELVSETTLREGNVVTQLLKNLDSQHNVVDFDLISDGFDAQLVSIHKDGRINLWSAKAKRVIETVNLNKISNENLADNFSIRFAQSSSIVVVCIQFVDRAKFMVVKMNEQYNSSPILAITAVKTRHVIDFMANPVMRNKDDEYSLWVLISETVDPDEREQTSTQPYSLWKCSLSLLNDNPHEWIRVRPAVPDSSMDDILFHSTAIEAIRHRIFNGDDYSFDAVQRAVHIVCKKPIANIVYNDWSSLIGFVEDFLQSGQFKQYYLGADDRNSLMILNPIDQQAWDNAVEKFWLSLYKCCNQFQEAGLHALRIWYSQELDIIGVIQQCRFTIYHPPDEHMRYLLNSTVDKPYLKECFLMAEKYAKNDLRLDLTIPENQRQNVLDNFLSNIDDLCRVIRLFAEHCPVDISTNLISCNSFYLASSFTTGLLSTAFRHRILGRLHFSHLVNAVIRLVTQLMKKLRQGSDDRWDSIIRTHDSTVLQILRYYSTLWTALSNRIDCMVPDEDGVLRHMTVAQAFFKYGNETMVKRLTNGRTHFIDEEEDEEDEVEANSRRGSSNQMRAAVYLSNPATTEFSKFVRDTLDAAMITLWPESTALTLPRFLTQNGYFEALQNYVLLNEPFISELAYAFRFFQGVAFSGLGHPQMAFESFVEGLAGIDTADDALNNVLSYLEHEPRREYTETDYLYIVMKFFKEHGHNQAVITTGEIIIQKAKEDIKVASSPQLPSVHMLLFSQHMANGSYSEAVQAILANSDSELQRGCLRDLVFVLLQTEKYKTFIDLDYKQLTSQVIEILEERCKNPDVQWESPIFDVFYAFHIQRCEFLNAARVMYEFLLRLRHELQNREILQKRCRVLATVFQTMHMLPDSEQLTLPINIDHISKRRIDTNFNDVFTLDRTQETMDDLEETPQDSVFILTKDDVQKELIKAEARLSLLDAYEQSNVPPLNEIEIVQDSIKHRLYDMAWLLISVFDLDPNELFADVTFQCINLDLEREDNPDFEDPLWVTHNRKFVDDSKGHIERYWKILIAYTDLALQKSPANSHILRTIAYTFLKYSLKLPAWLIQKYTQVNFADFLRTLLDYNELAEAFRHLSPFLDSTLKSITSDRARFYLPITHIDELLRLSDQSDLDLPVEDAKKKIKIIMDRYKNFCLAAESFQ
uniref:Nuclear pore complex protein Nup160 n=1 Tax=Acrobeloides nanus TaxID=290746 RepID=A0A914CBT9_9BILA